MHDAWTQRPYLRAFIRGKKTSAGTLSPSGKLLARSQNALTTSHLVSAARQALENTLESELRACFNEANCPALAHRLL
ncbi:hypothetical protein CHU98_g10359 [Xylaria longipes]|nr:hypothetical protein CHU98_g10359 [Xylaria longipes]